MREIAVDYLIVLITLKVNVEIHSSCGDAGQSEQMFEEIEDFRSQVDGADSTSELRGNFMKSKLCTASMMILEY